jgi:hypothetical protein
MTAQAETPGQDNPYPIPLTREPLPRVGASWDGGEGQFKSPRVHTVCRILPPLPGLRKNSTTEFTEASGTTTRYLLHDLRVHRGKTSYPIISLKPFHSV